MTEQTQTAGNYSSLLHIVSVCVDKANEILALDTMDIDGKDIKPENHNIRLDHISFSYDKRKIIDEATANVDPENEKELMDAIDALTKEKTIIMIAHRLKTVQHADQIVEGRIAQQGTHEQLMEQDGIYKKFVKSREQAVGWRIQIFFLEASHHKNKKHYDILFLCEENISRKLWKT